MEQLRFCKNLIGILCIVRSATWIVLSCRQFQGRSQKQITSNWVYRNKISTYQDEVDLLWKLNLKLRSGKIGRFVEYISIALINCDGKIDNYIVCGLLNLGLFWAFCTLNCKLQKVKRQRNRLTLLKNTTNIPIYEGTSKQ